MEIDRRDCEQRVLLLGPAGKDATTVRSALRRAGIASMRCGSVEQLRELLDEGAGAILLTEETIDAATTTRLRDWLTRQPPWSDPPVLVLARAGAEPDAISRAMDRLGNITVLESPVREALLVSTVRAALRARERQYQLRTLLSERERGIEAQALLAPTRPRHSWLRYLLRPD